MADVVAIPDPFAFPAGHAVAPVTREIAAPAALVYELMTAIGQGAQDERDGSAVLSRAGDELLCEFWTTVPVPILGRRVIRTREAVRLLPPDAIAFRHLDGPVRGLTERIRVAAVADGLSTVRYEAVLPGSGVGGFVRFLLARRAIERAVAEHLADIAARAEARAAKSRLHPPGQRRVATTDA